MQRVPVSKKVRSPQVSVILPVYNEEEKWLKDSINSIICQTLKDFELIIVFDNPKNKALEKVIRAFEKKDKRIKVLVNDSNQGLPYSINKGIKCAHADYIARMDGDDVAAPSRLKKQLNFIRKTDADIVCSNRTIIDSEGKYLGRTYLKRSDLHDLKKNIFKIEPHPIVHPSVFGKKSVFIESLYDERFRNSQDFELWLRMIAKGVRFELVEEPLLHFRVPDDENVQIRLEKNKRYNIFGLKALWKNFGRYAGNIYFYQFLIKMIFIRIVLLMPKRVVFALMGLKKRHVQ